MKKYLFVMAILAGVLFNGNSQGSITVKKNSGNTTTVIDHRKNEKVDQPNRNPSQGNSTVVDQRNRPNSNQSTPNNSRPTARGVFVWNADVKRYTRQNAEIVPSGKSNIFIKGLKMNWGLPVVEGDGGAWVKPDTKNSEFLQKKKEFLLKIQPKGNEAYPTYIENGKKLYAPTKSINLQNLNESDQYIGYQETKNIGLNGKDNKTNVFYFNKLKMGVLAISNVCDFLIVTDTLYLTQPAPLNNAIICVDNSGKRLYANIIANTVIYEGPLGLSLPKDADFAITTSNIFLKTAYPSIKPFQLKSNIPLAVGLDETANNHFYKNMPSNESNTLLNRLFLKQMTYIIDINLNSTNDEWLIDQLVERFQTLRYKKVIPELLAGDADFQRKFGNVCTKFDAKFKNYTLKRKRTLGGTTILVSGDLDQSNLKPLKYHILPTIATIKPIQLENNTQGIGTIKYNATGTKNMIMSLDITLDNAQVDLEKAQEALKKRGIELDKSVPNHLISITRQPLKINGKTLGEILPISNKLLRLELNLPNETNDIREFFPKLGNTSFVVDLKMSKEGSINQTLTVNLDKAILDKLDYTKTLDSFEKFEIYENTAEIQLMSNLFAKLENEGTLNYVETMVEIAFPNKTKTFGPFNLSAVNTLASKKNIPFLKDDSNYTVTISGRAFYENGIRELAPFTEKSEIINIDESRLK